MELSEIKKALASEGKIIFGYDPKGLQDIWVEKNKITFSTDTIAYIMDAKLEETLDILFNKFKVSKFEINMHNHKGKINDKDISLLLISKSVNHKAEIVKFIMDTFYNYDSWKYIMGNKNERK